PLVHRWLKNGKAWKAFLGWLQRFRAIPSFDEDERTYKLELAAKVRQARDALLAKDNGWIDVLKQAFHDGSNNLTQWQVHEKFLTWLDNDRNASASALRALWGSDEAPAERLQSFFDQVPTTGLGPTGERLNVGSYLLMAEDAASLPPMKI